jgi:hypothetical protein
LPLNIADEKDTALSRPPLISEAMMDLMSCV